MAVKKVLGLVLCGGKSTRMGYDKGLAIHNTGITWAENAQKTLLALCNEVYISVNKEQYSVYKQIFPYTTLLQDSPKILAVGPLKGILSAYTFLNTDLLVLACDMINMRSNTLANLTKVYQSEQEQYDFFCYSLNGFPEPLAAIYTSRGIKKVLDNTTNLDRCSANSMLREGHTFYLPILDTTDFKNINSEEDKR